MIGPSSAQAWRRDHRGRVAREATEVLGPSSTLRGIEHSKLGAPARDGGDQDEKVSSADIAKPNPYATVI
jgi:hypothetical protein